MMHGGKTPNGLALPQTKDGCYSKYMPVRLAKRFHTFLTEEDELLQCHESIALLDSRLTELLEMVSNGESGELWKRLRAAKSDYHKAKEDEKAAALRQVFWLIDEGHQDWQNWMEIRVTLEARRRLVATQVDNMHKDDLTAAESNAFILRMASGFKRIVDTYVPESQRQAAYTDTMQLVGELTQRK